jgi:DNA-binding Xre family transcriptional regulator
MSASSPIQPFLQEVGLRIRTMRKERGLTLADLGDNIGLDKSNTYRLEQGKNITLITLIKIAAFLGVHPKDIIEVPFESDFAQIEKAIAEKKKARKPFTVGQRTQTNRLYRTSNQSSSQAAEKKMKSSRK